MPSGPRQRSRQRSWLPDAVQIKPAKVVKGGKERQAAVCPLRLSEIFLPHYLAHLDICDKRHYLRNPRSQPLPCQQPHDSRVRHKLRTGHQSRLCGLEAHSGSTGLCFRLQSSFDFASRHLFSSFTPESFLTAPPWVQLPISYK